MSTLAITDTIPDHALPRVCHYPLYPSSAGQEAIELAASAGLILDPWQRLVLQHGLGEREDGRWASFEVGLSVARQQGKGSVLEARELAGLVLFGEKLIMHTAHELKTSMQHFKRLMALFENTDDLRKRVMRVSRSNGKEGLVMRNGAELFCIARSEGSGRGFSGDLVILDEAYALTDGQMAATMPTTLARDNAQVWYTSSPPLDAVKGAVLLGVRGRGEDPDPEVRKRLAWFDYGLGGIDLEKLAALPDAERAAFLNDKRNWYAALPALRAGQIRPSSPREESVQVLRDMLTENDFAREILGIWPPGLGKQFRIIPAEDWSDREDQASTIEGDYVLAAAVSVDRARASIAACGLNEHGRLHVEITSTPLRADNRNGTAWVVPRLAEIVRNAKDRGGAEPLAILMDEYGPTGSLIAQAEDPDGAALEITRLGTAAVAKAYGMFYDAVSGADRDGRILAHIGQPELTAAVAGAERRALGDGYAWDRRSPSVDITPLVAVTSAVYGWATRPDDHRPFSIW